jgi:hypothetical protein
MPVDRCVTIEDFDRMTPNERAEVIRAETVDWDKLPTEFRERINVWAVNAHRRRFPTA